MKVMKFYSPCCGQCRVVAREFKDNPINVPIEDINVVEEPEKVEIDTDNYIEETRIEVKPSLWERIKQSKFVQAIRNLTRIKIVIDVPALPEGRNK